MFYKILVPVDLGEPGPALEAAVEMARASQGRLLLLHVVETIDDVPEEEIRDFYATLERRSEVRLRELRSELRGAGLEVGAEVRFGKPAAEIIRFVEERGCDLVVLSSHRVDAETGAGGLGTLSHRVAILAPCPVLLVK